MLLSFSQYQNSGANLDIGKKAASLLTLIDMGLTVPDGAIIPSNVLQHFLNENNISESIYELAKSSHSDKELLEKTALIQQNILSANIPKELKQKIQTFVRQHPDWHFAIRSSGSREDLNDSSFAGMYDSYLNIKGKMTDISS